MHYILCLLAIYSLAFLIKEVDGPWGVIGNLRNLILRNGLVGVFFYQLLSCYYCVGFHCGWIVYLLQADHITAQSFILWGLAGAAWSLIMSKVMARLHKEEE